MTERAGDWVLHERIGRGRQATVWRASHAHRSLEAAVRVLHRPAQHDLRATMDRVAAQASLDHAHIVRLYDTGMIRREGQTRVWMAFEYLRGGTLAEREDTLDWVATGRVLEQVLLGLRWAHAVGVTHRDVKPENVLFRTARGSHTVLADFGMSWTGMHGGRDPGAGVTVAFAAPEQIVGSPTAQGPASDLYALGCLAWWCATGRPPFGSGDSRAVAFAHRNSPLPAWVPRFPVPAGFEAWVKGLLRKDPLARGWLQPALDRLIELQGRTPSDPCLETWRAVPRPAVTAGLVGIGRIPFHGRAAELTELIEALGSGARMALVGPNGSGRRALAQQLGRFGFGTSQLLPVQLRDHSTPFVKALEHWLRLSPVSDPDQALRHRLHILGLGDELDLALYGEAAKSIRGTGGCRNARGLLRRLWSRAAAGRPLLVVTDAKSPTVRAFLDSLVDSGDVTLGVRISEQSEPGERALTLQPLARSERRGLIESLAPLHGGLRDRVANASGWPGDLANRLTRLMPSLTWRDGWLVGSAPEAQSVALLDRAERSGLALAALMQPFRVEVWRRAFDGDADAVLQALHHKRKLVHLGSGVRLADPVVRRTALSEASPEQLCTWHVALAEACVDDALQAGEYWFAAGEFEAAFACWVPSPWSPSRSGQVPARVARAISHLEDQDRRTGACLAALAIAQARSFELADFAHTVQRLMGWMERCGDEGLRSTALLLHGWCALYDADFVAAEQRLVQGLTLNPDARVFGELHRSLGEVTLQQGRVGEAVRHLTHAVKSSQPDDFQRARLDLAWALGAACRPEEGLEVLRGCWERVAASERVGALQIRGDLQRWALDLDAAAEDYAASRRWAARLGRPVDGAQQINGLLLCWARGGADVGDLEGLVHHRAPWVRGAARAVAVCAGVLSGETGAHSLFEVALSGMETEGFSWDPDGDRLLRDAALRGPAHADRILAVLGDG